MTLKTFQFFNNTGGLNLRYNDVLISDNEAESIINLHPTTLGSWSNRNIGYIRLTETAIESGSAITSAYNYITVTGQSFFMLTAGDKLFSFNAAAGTTTEITSGLSTGAPMDFITFDGLLIGCNGEDPPKKWEGNGEVTNLGGWAPEISGLSPGNPSICEVFNNRIVFSGDSNYPSMIYLSEQEDPENFTPSEGATSAGAIQVSPGDGQRITGLKNMFLPLTNEEVLVIFKEQSTYLLIGTDADNFTLQKLSDEFGAVNSHCAIEVGNELLFLSREGITALSTATSQGNISTGFISHKIQRIINQLNTTYLDKSFALHLRNRQEVWWFVPEGSSTTNNQVLVYHYGDLPGWSIRTGIEARCGLLLNGSLFTGGYTGHVDQQLRGNTYNGDPIPWEYQTPFYSFATPGIRKRIRDVELYIKQVSDVTLSINTSWDLDRRIRNAENCELTVPLDSSLALYGSAVYNTDYYDDAGSSITQFSPNGSGQFFQMVLTGENQNTPIEIEGWTVSTIFGGYR